MIDDKVLEVIRKYTRERNGADDWLIASSIYNWDGEGMRPKHGAWITQVNQAGMRLQKRGLVGAFIVSHGLPGYNAPQSRVWFARDNPHP